MKTLISAFFVLFLTFFSTKTTFAEKTDNLEEELPSNSQQILQIISSPEVYDLASAWVEGYKNLNPGQKINLELQPETTDLQEGKLYLLTNQGCQNTTWKMAIGHNLVVAIVNKENPLLADINRKGFRAEDFATFVAGSPDWSMVIDNASKTPVKCYIVEEKQVTEKISEFTKINISEFQSEFVSNSIELISLIRKDIKAIGFCSLTEILNDEKNAFAEGLSVIPVDKNRNGRIDNFENIYTTPEALTRGAWIGKYPKELCGEIFVCSVSKPSTQSQIDFLTYLSGDGQENVKKSGFSILKSAEKSANMLLLTTENVSPSETGKKKPVFSAGPITALSLVALVLILFLVFAFKKKNQHTIESEDIEITPALNENSILAPRGLYYDKTHTWAFMEKDGLVKIGIDDFLKRVTGPFTNLKMKSPGEKVRKGEVILTVIRDGKQLNLYSPVTGFIRKQNEGFITNPTKINTVPYTEGWVYQIEPVNWAREVSFLYMFEKYREWLSDEFVRLKDFIALSANSNSLVYQHVVLQDGGELKDNVLSDLGPEIWEDFQSKFLDTSK